MVKTGRGIRDMIREGTIETDKADVIYEILYNAIEQRAGTSWNASTGLYKQRAEQKHKLYNDWVEVKNQGWNLENLGMMLKSDESQRELALGFIGTISKELETCFRTYLEDNYARDFTILTGSAGLAAFNTALSGMTISSASTCSTATYTI